MKHVFFSVIVCSIDAGKFARVSECYRSLLEGMPFEIIGIHDAKSLAEGYNKGMQQARGDILIFSHDDILILDPLFASKIADRLSTLDVLGFAGASKLVNGTWFGAGHPHTYGVVAHAKPKQAQILLNVFGVDDWPVAGGIKAIDGLCMIARREVAESVGFDSTSFDGFHLYDLDFSFSAYLAGYRLGICCDIPIIHESGGRFDSEHAKFADRFCRKHADYLDSLPIPEIPGKTVKLDISRGALLQDIESLKRAWQPDLLRRSTIGMRRSFRTG